MYEFLLKTIIMKNTEVQTSPMHASVPNCYVVIHMLVMLNATKYVIITDGARMSRRARDRLRSWGSVSSTGIPDEVVVVLNREVVRRKAMLDLRFCWERRWGGGEKKYVYVCDRCGMCVCGGCAT